MRKPNYRSREPAGLTLVELLVVIFLIGLAIAFLIPVLDGPRSGGTANRVKCASNLRQIGQALLLYSNDNRAFYPRTVYTPRPVVVPVAGTGITAPDPFKDGGPAANDVTAAYFLLLRTQEIGSEVFTCPSSNEEKDTFGGGANTAVNRSNFTDWKKNLSYSFQNPYPNESVKLDPGGYDNKLSPDFAVAADMNPGISAESVNLTTITTKSGAKEMAKGNSPNHAGDGQNVLYGDGHVEFQNNPFVGIDRDNIYLSKSAKVNESPVDEKDSVPLPAKQ